MKNVMNEESSIRLFIAAEMPKEVIDFAHSVQNLLRAKGCIDGTFTHTEGMHVTLKFLGETFPATIGVLDAVLKVVEAKPMMARLGSIDVFKHGPHIRIVFQHIVCKDLELLAHQIDDRLSVYYMKEERPFIAHVTLVRVKRVIDHEVLLDLINSLLIPECHFMIDRFFLKKSRLTAQGPMYENLKQYVFNP